MIVSVVHPFGTTKVLEEEEEEEEEETGSDTTGTLEAMHCGQRHVSGTSSNRINPTQRPWNHN